MHFVGMTVTEIWLPDGTEVPMYFDTGYTVLSAIVCVLTIAAGFYYASKDPYWNEVLSMRLKKIEQRRAEKKAKADAAKELLQRISLASSPSLDQISPMMRGMILASPRTRSKRPSVSRSVRNASTRASRANAVGVVDVGEIISSPISEEGSDVSSGPALHRGTSPPPALTPIEAPLPLEVKVSGGGSGLDDRGLAKSVDIEASVSPLGRSRILRGDGGSRAGINAGLVEPLLSAELKTAASQIRSNNEVEAAGPPPRRTLRQKAAVVLVKIIKLLMYPHRLLISGFLIASAVVAMHYVGLYSMRMHAYLLFNPGIVALSVIIAWVAATAGMIILFRIVPYYPEAVWKLTASAVIAVAVN
ncbi:hypothetical protein HK405_015248, partial [Cladochytrium tenue]